MVNFLRAVRLLLVLIALTATTYSFASELSGGVTDSAVSTSETQPTDADPQFFPPREPRDRIEIEQERKMAKARSEERFRELKKDAARILEVATELKQYVDKSGENIMSVEVIRKAEEMEKLSKDLKSRMKGDK